jgi:hypothetical protein
LILAGRPGGSRHFFCPLFKQITIVRDELTIAPPATVGSAATLRNCERHHRRRIRNPVSKPSHASNHCTRTGLDRCGSSPCQISSGVAPSKCACGRMQQYQSRKSSSAACNCQRFATCQQSSDCFSVPKKRSYAAVLPRTACLNALMTDTRIRQGGRDSTSCQGRCCERGRLDDDRYRRANLQFLSR